MTLNNKIVPAPASFVFVVGNPIEGFAYHGPFIGTETQAYEFGAHEFETESEWWVAPLLGKPTKVLEACPTCGSYEVCDCLVTPEALQMLTGGVKAP